MSLLLSNSTQVTPDRIVAFMEQRGISQADVDALKAILQPTAAVTVCLDRDLSIDDLAAAALRLLDVVKTTRLLNNAGNLRLTAQTAVNTVGEIWPGEGRLTLALIDGDWHEITLDE